MPKYRVYVTGTLDWDYELEAEDSVAAESEGENQFQRDFNPGWPWSGVETWEVEEIEDES